MLQGREIDRKHVLSIFWFGEFICRVSHRTRDDVSYKNKDNSILINIIFNK